MTAQQLPIAVGTITLTDDMDSDLGKLYYQNDKIFRFVKTSTAIITNAGGKVLVLGVVSGAPDWTVVETTTASDNDVAGVVPISTTVGVTTALAASTRFMIQVSGPATIKAANTTVAAPMALTTAATAGTIQSLTSDATVANAANAVIGYATNTAVATVASGTITCVLRSIV